MLAGEPFFREVFRQVDPGVEIQFLKDEGELLFPDDLVAYLQGPAQSILSGERTALNLLCHISGVATLTAKFVEAIKGVGSSARLLDTRKTTPLWRKAEKYAVSVGGGENHRYGLYDMFLIKENHLASCGGIKSALEKVEKQNPLHLPVEIEVKNLQELEVALDYRPDRIMLDNFNLPAIKEALKIREKRGKDIPFEVSGGIGLDNIGDYARTGVEFVSVGRLTHSARAFDFSLLIYQPEG